jgi:hypothetical protein
LHALSTPPAFILDQDQILCVKLPAHGLNFSDYSEHVMPIAKSYSFIGTTRKFLFLILVFALAKYAYSIANLLSVQRFLEKHIRLYFGTVPEQGRMHFRITCSRF